MISKYILFSLLLFLIKEVNSSAAKRYEDSLYFKGQNQQVSLRNSNEGRVKRVKETLRETKELVERVEYCRDTLETEWQKLYPFFNKCERMEHFLNRMIFLIYLEVTEDYAEVFMNDFKTLTENCDANCENLFRKNSLQTARDYYGTLLKEFTYIKTEIHKLENPTCQINDKHPYVIKIGECMKSIAWRIHSFLETIPEFDFENYEKLLDEFEL